MASSGRPETPLNIWAALSRLRDVSRLVLAAIDRSDVTTIEHLARESDALIKLLRPVLETRPGGLPMPQEASAELEILSGTFRAIVAGLEDQADEVYKKMGELKQAKGRLRRFRNHAPQVALAVDRDA